MLPVYFHILGVLLGIINCPQPTTAAQHCSSCTSEHIEECDKDVICHAGERCYSQLIHVSSLLLSPFNIYDNGCTPKDRCHDIDTTLLHSGGRFEQRKLLCGGCCDGHHCNKHLCDPSTTENPVTTLRTHNPHTVKGLECAECSKGAYRKDHCNNIVTCSDGEVCYAQITDIVSFLTSPHEKHYYSGCIQENKCSDVEHLILKPDGTYEYDKPSCGGCCNEPDCNRYLCHIHHTEATTTLKTTTSQTTVPTKSTNTATTTISTTIPTTTTSTTTTTTQATTITSTEIPSTSTPTTTTVTSTTTQSTFTSTTTRTSTSTSTSTTVRTTSTATTPTTTISTTAMPSARTSPLAVHQTQASTYLPPLEHCMGCVNEGFGWNCSHVDLCGQGQVCFVQELKLTASLPWLPNTYYHGGCMNMSECDKVGSVSVTDNNGVANVVQGECCNSNDCNKQIKDNYEFQKTTRVITDTTSSADTPTTIIDTTISVTQTTAIPPLSCEVCRGGLCGLIPGLDPVQLCTVDEPYCMNIVDNDASGLKTYTKRCSSETDCNTKWWKESSDNTECTEFDPMVPYTFPFTCSFCCITDSCNEDIYPKQNTLFQGTV